MGCSKNGLLILTSSLFVAPGVAGSIAITAVPVAGYFAYVKVQMGHLGLGSGAPEPLIQERCKQRLWQDAAQGSFELVSLTASLSRERDWYSGLMVPVRRGEVPGV